MARAKREDLKAVWDETPSCYWELLEHSLGALPMEREEWEEWTKMFLQYPTDEQDILFGRSAFEENEDEDEEEEENEDENEEEDEEMRDLLQENGDLAWCNFEESLRIILHFDSLFPNFLSDQYQDVSGTKFV